MREDKDTYFLHIADIVASQSTCLRHKVGAVIVRDSQILTTGYNGSPSGTEHCIDIGCIRDLKNIPSGTRHEECRAVHAEQNAIIQAAIHGVSIAGGSLYCTHQPCTICAKMIINAKIKRVVFRETYPDSSAIEMLKAGKVEIVELN